MAENRLTYLLVLIEEANYLKTQTEQTGSGHIFTTIRTLEHRIKEIRKELEQENEDYS
jgi:transposase